MTHPRIAFSKIAHSLGLKSNIRAGLILTTLMLMVAIAATPAAAQTYTVLYNFDGITATQPSGTLVQGRDGNLYGTTQSGGSSIWGVVFKITPDGALKVVYNFDGVHGGYPSDGLTLGNDGNLYGTAAGSVGAGGGGYPSTIFKITPRGNLTTLYTFSGDYANAGAYASPILGSDGNFYVLSTGGVAFKISPSGTFTEFGNSLAFHAGYDRLLQGTDGIFYFPAEGSSAGEIDKLTSGLARKLYTFHHNDGAIPYAVIEGPNGNLYGTTREGGSYGVGEVYELTPQGSL